MGFWVVFGFDGSWESFRFLFLLLIMLKYLEDNLIVMEVVMRNGKKYVIFRGFVIVINDTDVKLDIFVYLLFMIDIRIGDVY